ncbi:M14 family zinc carboxypeptidase [Syntrophomonas sp.]
MLIIPGANPDGIKQGWTCNGPGRCQLSQGIDINMDFDYDFKVRPKASP